MRIIDLAYIYQMTKFGDLMSCVSKDIVKNAPCLTHVLINTHHDVIDLSNHGMVRITKTWISWEPNITFLRNKKILNLCLRWHILRRYCFVAEVTFKCITLTDGYCSYECSLIYFIKKYGIYSHLVLFESHDIVK